MEEKEPIKLDVDGVVRSKMKGKLLPKPIMRFLKKILHEDDFNKFFKEHPNDEDFDFIREVLKMFKVNYTIEGIDNLPSNASRLMFASNHPLGGMDGMILALALGEHRNFNVKVIVTDFLMAIKPLNGIFVPVNKVGAQSREYARKIEELYDSDVDILTFPSGKCSRKINGKIQDPEWMKNFIRQSVKHKRDIVPIYFEGQNSKFFYNLALWRQRLGIRLNIEMLFLADEMWKNAGKTFHIKIGKPISYTTFDNSKKPQQWAAWMREKTYSL